MSQISVFSENCFTFLSFCMTTFGDWQNLVIARVSVFGFVKCIWYFFFIHLLEERLKITAVCENMGMSIFVNIRLHSLILQLEESIADEKWSWLLDSFQKNYFNNLPCLSENAKQIIIGGGDSNGLFYAINRLKFLLESKLEIQSFMDLVI